MSAPPFMSVYVADYTADTQHLTCEQDGAYWRLLRAMWRAGGRLPARHDKLALIAGLNADRWAEIAPDVLSLFTRRGSILTHKRLSAELTKYQSVCDRARAGGIASAAKRASKNNGGEGDRVELELVPKGQPKPNQPEPELEPEREDTPHTPQLPLVLAPPVDVGRQISKDVAFAAFWSAYPLKVAKLAAEKAFTTAWKTLNGAPQDRLALLVTGAENYRAETIRRALPPDKIAHPSTWLNQGRWMDAPPPKPPIWDGVQ